MTCLNFENRVQELLDCRQIELPDDLAAHVVHCSVCHELWRHLQQLEQVIDVWRAPPPSLGLAEVVLQRLPIEFQTTSQSQISTTRPACSPLAGFVVLLASAAALLIAFGIGWRVSSNAAYSNRQTVSTTTLAAKTTEVLPSSASSTDRQLDVLLHDARDAYFALASQAWQDVTSAHVLLPPPDIAIPFNVDDSTTIAPESLSLPLAPFGREIQDAVDSWLQLFFQNQESST